MEQNGPLLGSEINEGPFSTGFSVERFISTIFLMLMKQTPEARKNKCHTCQDFHGGVILKQELFPFVSAQYGLAHISDSQV